MNAIGMLVRRAWRRHALASLVLALIAGATAALVGASFQAADRASTSLERFADRSRVYDMFVQGCPPGIDPQTISSQTELINRCANPTVQARLQKVLAALPGVERAAGAATIVAALLDPSASNGWGRGGLLEATTTPGARLDRGNPIVVEGRNIDPAARDEIVLGEAAARGAGIHAGDTVRMAGWSQEHLDAAIDGEIRPETRPFPVQVVGIVRFLGDVQSSADTSLSDALLAGNIYAGPGWYAAHGADFSGYGSGVIVRLRGGPTAAKHFRQTLNGAPEGWLTNTSAASDISASSPQKVIDLQRRSVLVFAAIAAMAGIAFVGSTLIRQLGRESEEVRGLAALGMTGHQRRAVNVARALTVGLPAAAVAVIGVIALSPLGPIGLARDLEFSVGIRIDPVVLALTAAGVLVLAAVAGAAAPVSDRRVRAPRARVGRIAASARAIGPVAAVGATVARGRSTRAAITMTAVAVSATIAAAGVVTSYDHLVGDAAHYGAWWDVAVGQYSERTAFDHGLATLRSNRSVIAAAGYSDETDAATVDGRKTRVVAATSYIGNRRPLTQSGRAPRSKHEIALGRDTAAQLGKGIGDDVVAAANNDHRVRLKVVGIAIINDPISSDANAGIGAVVVGSALSQLTGPGGVPQSIVVGLDPHRDRVAAIASLQRSFSGSIRGTRPQLDILNAGRLRTVPWILAGLIAVLALATLVHALATMLARHRTTMAVVGAIGFTRGQRRAVAITASTGLVAVGAIVGAPIGLVLASRVWTAVADGIGLDADLIIPWGAAALAIVGALAVATVVALLAARGSLQMRTSQQLRVE